MSRTIGLAAEQRALNYLLTQKLHWVESNYQCRWGEIDLIMQDKNYLVFVEVRARSSSYFGGAAASVITHKQKKLLKTAMHYLVSKKILDKQPSRFDVISIQGIKPQIDWIKNAFGLDF